MRLIDADKLHYKKVYIQDSRTFKTKSAVVVFAKEIDKAAVYATDYAQIKTKYVLTKQGTEKVNLFINECAAKRKEILDAGLDTADDTNLPTEEAIVSDLNYGVGVDEDGDYYNMWGVTDNYDYDLLIGLSIHEDFVEVK